MYPEYFMLTHYDKIYYKGAMQESNAMVHDPMCLSVYPDFLFWRDVPGRQKNQCS